MFIPRFRRQRSIPQADHEKIFIFRSTRETQPAGDGQSFTQALVSVCRENEGTLPILDIARWDNTLRWSLVLINQ